MTFSRRTKRSSSQLETLNALAQQQTHFASDCSNIVSRTATKRIRVCKRTLKEIWNQNTDVWYIGHSSTTTCRFRISVYVMQCPFSTKRMKQHRAQPNSN